MKKSKILISAVTMFSLCITPMSAYAQVDPNSNIENTISQTKSAENLPTPVLHVNTDQTEHTARRFSAWLPPIQCTLSGHQCMLIIQV